MTSPDLKVATQVKFALLDLRVQKKPRITEILKKLKKVCDLPLLMEVDHAKCDRLKASDFDDIIDRHIVIVLQESVESPYPTRAAEMTLLKKINNELLKK